MLRRKPFLLQAQVKSCGGRGVRRMGGARGPGRDSHLLPVPLGLLPSPAQNPPTERGPSQHFLIPAGHHTPWLLLLCTRPQLGAKEQRWQGRKLQLGPRHQQSGPVFAHPLTHCCPADVRRPHSASDGRPGRRVQSVSASLVQKNAKPPLRISVWLKLYRYITAQGQTTIRPGNTVVTGGASSYNSGDLVGRG